MTVLRNRLIALLLAAVIGIGVTGSVSAATSVAATKSTEIVAVTLPKANVKPGDRCRQDEAGCPHGKFTGQFFGN